MIGTCTLADLRQLADELASAAAKTCDELGMVAATCHVAAANALHAIAADIDHQLLLDRAVPDVNDDGHIRLCRFGVGPHLFTATWCPGAQAVVVDRGDQHPQVQAPPVDAAELLRDLVAGTVAIGRHQDAQRHGGGS